MSASDVKVQCGRCGWRGDASETTIERGACPRCGADQVSATRAEGRDSTEHRQDGGVLR